MFLVGALRWETVPVIGQGSVATKGRTFRNTPPFCSWALAQHIPYSSCAFPVSCYTYSVTSVQRRDTWTCLQGQGYPRPSSTAQAGSFWSWVYVKRFCLLGFFLNKNWHSEESKWNCTVLRQYSLLAVSMQNYQQSWKIPRPQEFFSYSYILRSSQTTLRYY